MPLLTYNFSLSLKSGTEKIDSLRNEILLIPIPPQEEVALRFEAMLNRIYWFWSLQDNPVNKHTLRNLFSSQFKKQFDQNREEIIDYRKALDWTYWNWLGSSETILPTTILELYNLSCFKTSGKAYDFLPVSETINYFLEYLQKGKEHPVIQAAISYIQLIKIAPFDRNTAKIAHLAMYLTLYKHYYYFRGLLVIEQIWKNDLLSYKKNLQAAIDNDNLNLWLDYFVLSMINACKNIIHTLSLPQISSQTAKFTQLNDRQKEILSLLDDPKETIANSKVQQIFKISQITASRDLAKLANLNMILTHSKGRSVYYTRA